ncbi:MAG: SDR family NAD(P)-dependent oxidoreductase [Pseudomonadales bacterium]|jgi:NAD(P)-dependent dehydrogenase (short-subunit alcohol dehydrogenase family)
MKEFAGKMAVVTGGGTGMGRELCLALAGEGAHVATCDVSEENMAETRSLCEAAAPAGTRITTHICDVSNEAQMNAFRDAVVAEHETDHVNLVFNNAGIGGGGDFVEGDRAEWERTFGVCWYGVYYGSRAFMPLLVASDEGYLVNTSSVNGFWASIGPMTPHTAYCAAKFAVKGFSEALITNLRVVAPHVKVAVVMPGHIGTSIALNTSRVLGKGGALDMPADEVALIRKRWVEMGIPVDNVPDDDIRQAMHQRGIDFRDKAPTTAAQAAQIILDGVRNDRWRILVGADAERLDQLVREAPEEAYEPSFRERLAGENIFGGLTGTQAENAD